MAQYANTVRFFVIRSIKNFTGDLISNGIRVIWYMSSADNMELNTICNQPAFILIKYVYKKTYCTMFKYFFIFLPLITTHGRTLCRLFVHFSWAKIKIKLYS